MHHVARRAPARLVPFGLEPIQDLASSMPWTHSITYSDILTAIAEYGRLGADGVARQWGYRAARRYWLVWEQKRYPSKAIVGIAAGVTRWEGKLNGGVSSSDSAVCVLRCLGFEVLEY